MVKLFLFDLGKVLIDFDFKIALRNLKSICAINELKVGHLFRNSSLAQDWDKGLISSEKFFQSVQKELDLPLTIEKFKQIWNEIFTEKTEMINLARALKLNHKVVILSNTNPWHADYVREKFLWMRHWDDFIASSDVHLLKPDPEIFKLAIDRVGVEPSRTIYVDDIPDYVKVAKKLGMDALIFKGHQELVNEIRLRNIKV